MIIICEPQCKGLQHADFNTALIKSISLAFPSEKVAFFAEREHGSIVTKSLEKYSIDINHICISIPNDKLSLKRIISEYSTCRKICDYSIDNRSEKVVFSSITSTTLISLKTIMNLTKKYKTLKCIIIPHSILEEISARPPLIPWFRFSLSLGNIAQIRYVVLGESIKLELIKELPKIERYVDWINHPYLFPDYTDFTYIDLSSNIQFGSFGIGTKYKGTDLFFKLAEEVQRDQTKNKSKFTLVGHISNKAVRKLLPGFVYAPSPDRRLSRDEFNYYAKDVNYSIYLYNKNAYRLTASGALMDAFLYVKPIIAIKNPFFEYYFKLMGDIGYLCDDYEDLLNTVKRIVTNPDNEKYVLQQKNIVSGIKQFDAGLISEKIKCICNNI